MKKPRQSYFVGVRRIDARREVFAVVGDFKARTYRRRYLLAVGPFGNARAAHFVAQYGGNAPKFRCSSNVERVCHGKPLTPRKRLELTVKSSGEHHAGERPYDLIDKVLDEVGGVPRKPRGMHGEKDTLFAGYDAAAKAGVLALLPSVKLAPDQVASAVGYESAEDLWNDLASAAKARRGERGSLGKERRMLNRDAEEAEDFAKSALCDLNFSATGRPIKAGRLQPGDTFKVQGEVFEIQSVDRLAGVVTAKGGERFGLQRLPVGMKLCPDARSLKRKRRSRILAVPEVTGDENAPF